MKRKPWSDVNSALVMVVLWATIAGSLAILIWQLLNLSASTKTHSFSLSAVGQVFRAPF
jgi:hypothetical protein